MMITITGILFENFKFIEIIFFVTRNWNYIVH